MAVMVGFQPKGPMETRKLLIVRTQRTQETPVSLGDLAKRNRNALSRRLRDGSSRGVRFRSRASSSVESIHTSGAPRPGFHTPRAYQLEGAPAIAEERAVLDLEKNGEDALIGTMLRKLSLSGIMRVREQRDWRLDKRTIQHRVKRGDRSSTGCGR